METGTSFDSTKQSLQKLLEDIRDGEIQLPDFQRGWIWDDDHVKSLLASVSVSFPIGSIMLLETGNLDVKFKPRLVEGVDSSTKVDPSWLILDGQQRLTALFQALFSGKPVNTFDSRKKSIERLYYLHIPTALDTDADQEDMILSVPPDKKLRNFRSEVERDFSSIELECENDVFPLSLIFDTPGMTGWQLKYISADPEKTAERLATWNRLVQSVIHRFQQYQIPLIKLFKNTPKEAVCQVFEKVNTGGVSLTVFELLTATFAAEDYNLRTDWDARKKRLKQSRLMAGLDNDHFLQAVALLATKSNHDKAIDDGLDNKKAPAITCKRRDILRLKLKEYEQWSDPVTVGFERAVRFLHSQAFFASRDLPYRTQLVPLAAIMALLGDKADNDATRSKLAQWFWCGVFGELYGSAVESRFAKDLPEVLAWLETDGKEPDTVQVAHFSPNRLHSLRTRNSAAYKGIYALLIKDGGLDFRTGEGINAQMYFDDAIDIHHIFPRNFCDRIGIEQSLCDCVINKTALSSRTNRIIGGSAPSEYINKIKSQFVADDDRMRKILESHVIDPDTLENDDFQAFFKARKEALLERIESAMGKPILRDLPADAEESDAENHDFEEEEAFA